MLKKLLQNKKLLIILGIALFLRLLIPLVSFIIHNDPLVYYSGDSSSYIQPTEKLLQTGRFFSGEEPVLFRTPGYPLLLIPGVLLSAVEPVTIILQILISCLTVFFIYKLAELLLSNKKASLFAALLFALEPVVIIFCGLLLTETLFTFVFTLCLYFLFRFLKTHSISDCIITGILLSALSYIRPIAQFLHILVLIVIVCYIIIQRKKFPIKKIAIIVAMVFLLNGAWILRNGVTAEYWGFASVSDTLVYSYQAASVRSVIENRPYYDIKKEMEDAAAAYQQENNLTPAQISAYMRKEGVKIILENPFVYAQIHIKGMIRGMFTPGSIEYLKMLKLYPMAGGGLMGEVFDKGVFAVTGDLFINKPVLFWSMVIFFIQLILYFFLFAWHFISKKRLPVMYAGFLLAFLGYFFILSGGPHTLDRFRHPMMPIICLFAGAGLYIIYEKFIKKMKQSENEKPKRFTENQNGDSIEDAKKV